MSVLPENSLSLPRCKEQQGHIKKAHFRFIPLA